MKFHDNLFRQLYMCISKSLSMRSWLIFIALYWNCVVLAQAKTSPTISAWELQCLLAEKVKRMFSGSLMWGNIDEFMFKIIFTVSEFFIFLTILSCIYKKAYSRGFFKKNPILVNLLWVC